MLGNLRYVRAIAITVFVLSACTARPHSTAAVSPKAPSMIEAPPRSEPRGSQSVSVAATPTPVGPALANAAGVHIYDLASGNTRKRCDGPAANPWYVTQHQVAFVDLGAMTVDICELRSGTRRTLAEIRLGDHGVRPEKASLWLTEDSEHACVFVSSRDMSGWQVIAMADGTSEYRLREHGQQAVRAPPVCDRPSSSPAGGGPKITLSSDGAFMFPAFLSMDGRWAIGGVSPDATHESAADAFSAGKQVLVFVADLRSKEVFPLKAGSWPKPLDTTKPFSNAVEVDLVGVAFGDTVANLPYVDCVAVGPYLVELGTVVRLTEGKFAVSAKAGEARF